MAIIMALLCLSWVMPVYGSDPENSGVKVYCNGQFRGSTAYIDPGSGTGMVPLALIQSIPGLRLDVRNNQAWFALNGKELNCTVGSDTYIMDGQIKNWRCGLQNWQYGIAVPGRDLLEALGADVQWDEKERAILITVPLVKPADPVNLSKTSLPLRIAFIQDEQLWLLDAKQAGAQPFLTPGRNVKEIIGWSYDGQWLAYLQRSSESQDSGAATLWTVSSDGRQTQCLDTLPLAYSTPVWSPTENIIAYQIQPDNSIDNPSLRIAGLENGKWQCRELLPPADRPLGLGLTWFPDGRSLAVSRIHDEMNLPELDRVDLQGNSNCLLVLSSDLAGNYEDGFYIRDMAGLKISPDRRYLACFLGMNSGSMNADGMSFMIFDLQQKTSIYNGGSALGYPQWVQWSPDSRKLAIILGSGREASTGKYLQTMQIDGNSINVQDLNASDQADSRPIWDIDGNSLYFSRGGESIAWMEEGRHQEVQVPGQQIVYCQNGNMQSITEPIEQQGDYPLSLSPSGQYLALQRLNFVDQGAICLIDRESGQWIKLMDNIQFDPGYYGNYYPDGVSIYWLENKQ